MHVYTCIIAFICCVIVSTYAVIPPDMMQLMNPKAYPCQNFYKYACGSWVQQNSIPRTRNSIDSSSMVVNDHIDDVIAEIVERKHPIVRELWDSCMDITALTERGNEPLQKDLNRIRDAENKAQLIQLAGEFARTGGSPFVDFSVGSDPSDASQMTMLFRPKLAIPNHHFYDEERFSTIQSDYGIYIHDLMSLADIPILTNKRKRNSFGHHSDIVITIEQDLFELKNKVGDTIFPVSIRNAKQLWPNFFSNYTLGMQLSNSLDDVNIYVPFQYFYDIEEMIKNQPMEVLKVYIMFTMVHSRARWLGRDFDHIWWKFFRQSLTQQKEHLPRSKVCRNVLKEYLPDLIGQEYYKKTYNPKREAQVLGMFKLIRKAMVKHIYHATWLDKDTERNDAIEKLRKIKAYIGQSKVSRTYPSVLSREDFPGNMYTIMSHSFDAEMKKVGNVRNPEEWPVSAATANVQYLPYRNALVLPAGILQPPFYYVNGHPARSFGALGAIIGHELIHGFDVKGSLYDGDGNESPWWNPTKPEYTKRTQCFEDQYSKFEVNKRFVNGKLTVNENIADNGGVALAWDAYRNYMTTYMPDINGFTAEDGEKMFFLAYGQMWCEKVRDKTLFDRLAWSKHSPGKARLNGVVRNSEKFAKVYKCKKTTAECSLW